MNYVLKNPLNCSLLLVRTFESFEKTPYFRENRRTKINFDHFPPVPTRELVVEATISNRAAKNPQAKCSATASLKDESNASGNNWPGEEAALTPGAKLEDF